MTKDNLIPGDPSWWLNEALSAERNPYLAPPLIGDVETDIAIVGGGFTGLWTALAIKERSPNTSVVLIEAGICGSGASGKNGGKVHGYWSALPGLVSTLGSDAALAVARAGTRAQEGIRAFANVAGRDVWWREAGNVRVSTSPAQDKKIAIGIETAERLGVQDTVHHLTREMMSGYCRSPMFRGGLFLPEGATVHPARLVRDLRKAAIEAGIFLHENTPMVGLATGIPNLVRVPKGQITAKEVVLATNTGLAKDPDIRPHVTVFSSYALMTDPAPDALETVGWNGDEGLADMRMFLHYFRKTPDGRILMGTGSGPISYNGDASASALTQDVNSGDRAVKGLRNLLPALRDVGIAKVWGGGIDLSADRIPIFRTRPGTHVHYAVGYSGHGVNPTYIGGQCLASLALGLKDDWTALPFCTREPTMFPPEPFRTFGARIVRRGILACEEADERGELASWPMRAAAAIPKFTGMQIGTR